MRISLVLGATLATALALASVPAQAQGAWCAKISAGKDHVYERCDYRTFEACRQDIIGQGTSFCVQSHYGPREPEKAKPRRKRHAQPRCAPC
jgi:hypothetical protein